ncbi:hypothetical protein [Sphaerisporangium sp. TRM90804]|uniref:hypothetical protein n=1 Tax=Sphaerisporangium sp. TRM90804 TaxID=3031113 RepID=UPI0024488F63|nr:hypothetical protein [Sphaerisporangium sp. TRM90804]MDH2424339.1 hypothetical protein [Sphaerisporangium sp. TRM90804]
MSDTEGKRSPLHEPVPKTLRKLLVTLAIGSLTYALSDNMAEDQAWTIMLTAFISGVVFVVQYLVDVDNQLQESRVEARRQHENLHRLVGDGLSRINEATELFRLVEISALQMDVVTQFLRNATKVGADMPELVQHFAQSEIARMSSFLKELGEGSVIYEGEDRDWLLGLAGNARTSIDALSLNIVDQGPSEAEGGFWFTDLGERYLRIQQELVERHCRVRRIFFLDSPERLQSEMFRRIWRRQAEIGIEVRVLTPADVKTSLGLSDIIVFDDVITYEVTPSPSMGELAAHTVVSTRLVLEPLRVAERSQRFKELWALAATPE